MLCAVVWWSDTTASQRPARVRDWDQPRTFDLLHRGEDNQQSYSQNLRMMSVDSLVWLLSRDRRWNLTLREILRSLAASRIHLSQRQILLKRMQYAGFLSSTGRGEWRGGECLWLHAQEPKVVMWYYISEPLLITFWADVTLIRWRSHWETPGCSSWPREWSVFFPTLLHFNILYVTQIGTVSAFAYHVLSPFSGQCRVLP